jgi:Uma2 family endonuclease
MGHADSRHVLAARWAELLNDVTLRRLPYKVELNQYGNIEMSPASTRHGRLQAFLAVELTRQIPGGEVLTECAVITHIGVRVPDVAWASEAFRATWGDASPLPQAPEICIEVVSPSNSDDELVLKIGAYLQAGAKEVWVVRESGAIEVHATDGVLARSKWLIRLDFPPPRSVGK